MTTAQSTDAPLTLRPPRHRVERRAIAWWTLRASISSAFLLAVVLVPYTLWEPTRSWLTVPLIAVIVWAAVNMVVQPWWRYAVHRWESSEHAVYGLSGWVVREWRVAPISRIQTVDAVRGPLEQLMGLSTLRVTTASSRGAITIVGLDKDVAADWADRLTVIVERSEGDAT